MKRSYSKCGGAGGGSCGVGRRHQGVCVCVYEALCDQAAGARCAYGHGGVDMATQLNGCLLNASCVDSCASLHEPGDF